MTGLTTLHLLKPSGHILCELCYTASCQSYGCTDQLLTSVQIRRIKLIWTKRKALNVTHAQMWVIQRCHSSPFRHRLYKGGLANICNIHKTVDLESGLCSMTVGGNSLNRNLWKIPFEDNRTWQLSALVVKSVGRKAWLAMSDPRQAVLTKSLAKPFSTLGIINAEKALYPAAAWEELIGKHG